MIKDKEYLSLYTISLVIQSMLQEYNDIWVELTCYGGGNTKKKNLKILGLKHVKSHVTSTTCNTSQDLN